MKYRHEVQVLFFLGSLILVAFCASQTSVAVAEYLTDSFREGDRWSRAAPIAELRKKKVVLFLF